MKFDELGLHEGIMEGIETMNFKEMTPVQEQTIPIILEGKDLDRLRSDRHRAKRPPIRFRCWTVCCTRAIRTMW